MDAIQDSIPPRPSGERMAFVADTKPDVADARKRGRRHMLIVSFCATQACSTIAGAFIYVRFINPFLGEFKLQAGLLAFLFLLASLSSLATHLLILKSFKD